MPKLFRPKRAQAARQRAKQNKQLRTIAKTFDSQAGFTIVDAPRPVDDTPETWRTLVRNGLRDYPRQSAFDKDGFVECDTCSARPGSPELCAGCLANRLTIQRLQEMIR